MAVRINITPTSLPTPAEADAALRDAYRRGRDAGAWGDVWLRLRRFPENVAFALVDACLCRLERAAGLPEDDGDDAAG